MKTTLARLERLEAVRRHRPHDPRMGAAIAAVFAWSNGPDAQVWSGLVDRIDARAETAEDLELLEGLPPCHLPPRELLRTLIRVENSI